MTCTEGWVPDWSCSECDPEQVGAYVDMAVAVLSASTGDRYGLCEVTVRPCRDSCCGSCGGHLGGYWSPRCSCRRVSEIVLDGPVHSITSVVIDGLVVDPATYRVDDWRWLVRLDGEWPRCSDAVADGPGSFLVTYLQGVEPPAGAGLVIAELACELWKAACGDTTCRLPKRMAQQTRQGITITYHDFRDDGTGLPNVDMWISAVTRTWRKPSVYSPDIQEHRRTTWEHVPQVAP